MSGKGLQFPLQIFCRLSLSVFLLSTPTTSFTYSFPLTPYTQYFGPSTTCTDLSFLCTLRLLSFGTCSSYSDNAHPPTFLLSEHPLSPSRHPPLPPTLFDPTQAAGLSFPLCFCLNLDPHVPRCSLVYNHTLGLSPPLDEEPSHISDAQ